MMSSYVGASGSGFVAVVNGQVVGNYATQNQAEQAFNTASGLSNTSTAVAPTTSQTFSTPNGQKTLQEMITGLQGAGWNGNYSDPNAVAAAYNQTASGGGGGGGIAPAAGSSSATKLMDAIASGDTAKFNEAIREFNAQQSQQQSQFNAQQGQQQGQFATSNYTDLAKSLLGTAAQLRGPQDYYQYQKYASGGRDLFQSLYGNQPMPAFSGNRANSTGTPGIVGSSYAPGETTAGSPAASVTGLLSQLGVTQSPIAGTAAAVGASTPGAPAGAPVGSYMTVNGVKTVDQMYQELKSAGWGGNNSDPNAVATQYASTTGNPVTPGSGTTAAPAAGAGAPAGTYNTVNGPRTVDQMYQELKVAGWGGTASDPAQVASVYASTTQNPVTAMTGAAPTATTGGTYGAGTAVPQVPVPYQINPGVWDSMSPVQQKLVMSAAAAGNPAYDDQDFLRQLNAQRPAGQAPAATTTNYSTPAGAF